MTKFQIKDKVLHDGVEKEIKVATKNFSTKEIIYLLDTGEKIPESELKPIKAKMTRTKKPNKKEQAKLLKERLELVEPYQEMLEASEGFNQDEFNKAIVALSNDDFGKFQEDLLEKSLLIEDNNIEDSGNEDNTED